MQGGIDQGYTALLEELKRSLADCRGEDAIWDRTLRLLGPRAAARRAYALHIDPDGVLRRRAQWFPRGEPAELDESSLGAVIAIRDSSAVRAGLGCGEPALVGPAHLSPAARRRLARASAESVLIVPISAGGFAGFVGFDSVRLMSAWPVGLADALVGGVVLARVVCELRASASTSPPNQLD